MADDTTITQAARRLHSLRAELAAAHLLLWEHGDETMTLSERIEDMRADYQLTISELHESNLALSQRLAALQAQWDALHLSRNWTIDWSGREKNGG